MTHRSFFQRLSVFALVASPVAIGCSSTALTPDSSTEQNVIPASATNLFDQAPVCASILKRHDPVRSVDMKDGSIRWNCADVPGVSSLDLKKCNEKRKTAQDLKASIGPRPTPADKLKLDAAIGAAQRECQGFGQEYCEYQAVAAGQPVTSLDQTNGAALKCVFTSVFADTRGKEALPAAMAKPENLGATPPAKVVQMQVGFNSNGAAQSLIRDCRDEGKPELHGAELLNEARQAACWQQSVADTSKTALLAAACRGKDLSNEQSWKEAKALGAAVLTDSDPGFDAQRDLAACLGSKRAQGVTWRNSDNMICGRVMRASTDCACDYSVDDSPLPIEGFFLSGWNNDQLPPGCRYGKVEGKDYQNLVICDVSAADQDDLAGTANANDLQAFCHDKFSVDIVMKAPLRAVEKKDSCSNKAGFCTTFQGKATPVVTGAPGGAKGS